MNIRAGNIEYQCAHPDVECAREHWADVSTDPIDHIAVGHRAERELTLEFVRAPGKLTGYCNRLL